ncbi:MAG: hypothetical protein EOM51_07430 [Clostridia bacterium]|nr:hypothetical protein [Clostridia bacterium]
MSNIETYIESMRLKKAVGGFDKESVYTSMQELSSLYQKDIAELKNEKERLSAELKRLNDDKEQSDKEMLLLKFQLEEEQKHREEYNERINALTHATETVRGTREKLLEETKAEADEILSKAEEDASEILATANQKASDVLATANQKASEIIARANEKAENARHECFVQKQQKEQIIAKIAEAKQQYSSSMVKIRSSLAEILTELDDLQNEEEKPAVKFEAEAKQEDEVVRTVIYERPNRLVRKVTGYAGDYDRR